MCSPYFSWIVILWDCELLLLQLSVSSGYSWNLSNPSDSFLNISTIKAVQSLEFMKETFDLRTAGFQLLYIFLRSKFMKDRDKYGWFLTLIFFFEVGNYEGEISCIDLRTTGFQLSYSIFSLCFHSFRFILYICYFILCFYFISVFLLKVWNCLNMFKAQK